MNAKIFKTISLAVLVFLVGFNVYKVQTAMQLSDTQLKNVEALAASEEPPFTNWVQAEMDEVSPTCHICKWKNNSECNINDQLPDCYD